MFDFLGQGPAGRMGASLLGGAAGRVPGGLSSYGGTGLLGALDAPRRSVGSALLAMFGGGDEPQYTSAQPSLPIEPTPLELGDSHGDDSYSLAGPAMGGRRDPFNMMTTRMAGAEDPVASLQGLATRAGLTQDQAQAQPQQPPRQGSLLPALLGAGVGVGSAFVPGLQPFAPWIGAGAMGLAQMANEHFNPDSSASMQGSNFLVNMAMDPMTYAGAIQGSGLLSRAGQAPSRLGQLTTPQAMGSRPPIAPPTPVNYTAMESASPASFMQSARPAGAQAAEGMIRPPMAPVAPPPPPGLGGYEPEQLQQMFGLPAAPDIGPLAGAGKAYRNVNQQVSPLLQEMGMMQPPGAASNFNVFEGGLPNWTAVRGGRVMPAPGYGEVLPHMEDLAGMSGAGHPERMRMLERLQALMPEVSGAAVPRQIPPGPMLPPHSGGPGGQGMDDLRALYEQIVLSGRRAGNPNLGAAY